MRPARRGRAASPASVRGAAPALAAAAVLAACATSTSPPTAQAPPASTRSEVLGRTVHVLVVRARPGDTAGEIARRYLKDPSQAWRVAALGGGPPRAGEAVAVPLDADDPGAAGPAREVPVLCYHRFTTGRSSSLMEVAASSFDAQLRWLRDNGYTVVPLQDVVAYVEGRRALAPRSVAITIDDGYRSALTVALPVLKRYGDPATLFVYTDFVGSKDGLSWADVDQLGRESLISVQSHSKTHRDMRKRLPGESAAAYAARRQVEVAAPQAAFAKRSAIRPEIFAYPFGSADPDTVTLIKRQGMKAAFTVARGGNPPWAAPFLLHRDMIYGTDDVTAFAQRVQAAERGPVEGPSETEQ